MVSSDAKNAAWFSYNKVRLGQGRENVKQFLHDNPDLFQEIKAAVLAKRLPPRPEPNAKDAPESAPSNLPIGEAKATEKPVPAKRKRA